LSSFAEGGGSAVAVVCLAFGIKRSASALRKSGAEGPTALPKAGANPKLKATDFIAFALVVIFLLLFSAQKSHVKSPNHLTQTNETRSSWHVSFTPTAIMNI
jgi:hypothetical protein